MASAFPGTVSQIIFLSSVILSPKGEESKNPDASPAKGGVSMTITFLILRKLFERQPLLMPMHQREEFCFFAWVLLLWPCRFYAGKPPPKGILIW
jgi:hypothetical protein